MADTKVIITARGREQTKWYKGAMLSGTDKAILGYLNKRKTPASVDDIRKHMIALGYTGARAVVIAHLQGYIREYVKRGFVKRKK